MSVTISSRICIQKQDNGYYTIRSQFASGKYLGVSSANVGENNVKFYSAISDNTLWSIYKNGTNSYIFEPKIAIGKCMYAPNNEIGTELQLALIDDNLTASHWGINTYTYGQTPGIQNNGVYYLINSYSGLYMEGNAGSENDVYPNGYTGSNSQTWKITYVGDGLYRIISLGDKDPGYYCLEKVQYIEEEIGLASNNGAPNTLFYIFPNADGTFRIQNRYTRTDDVLTIYSSYIVNRRWEDDPKQEWFFVLA